MNPSNNPLSPLSIGVLMHNFSQPPVEKPSPRIYRYPYMDKGCINITIQNAKKFASAFNQEQKEKSSSIIAINRQLRKNIKDMPHTTLQKVKFKDFLQEEKLKTAEPVAYNHAILQYNRENGTNFLMREYPLLRNEVAVTFGHLVIFYAAQMRDGNARRLNAGITTTQALPRLRTNSESLKRYKVEDVPQNPYKNDAILKHVHTLVRAGILINYKNHGQTGGFSVEFNPEILVVSEVENGKIQNAENVQLSNFKTCKDGYSGLVTGTVLNDNEIKEDIMNVAPATDVQYKNHKSNKSTYKNTKSEETPSEKENQGRGNFAKNSPAESVSSQLEAKVREKWPLCQELAENVHVNHIPMDAKVLENEAINGTMSQQFFRILLFQEFMKYVSRLKKGNQSAAGAFYKAFDELEDKKMITFTGKFFTKTLMLEEFKKWLWMVDHAERWSKKNPNFNLLYINDYLDTQRRDAKEVGFWYLEKQWNHNEKKKAERKTARKQARVDHLSRKKKIKLERVEKFGFRSVKPTTKRTDFEKAQIYVRKFLKNEISFDDLYRYCQYNLTQTIVEGLENLIDAERKNLRKFNA